MARSSYKSKAKRKIKNKMKRSPIVFAIVIILAVICLLFSQYGEKLTDLPFLSGKEIGDTVPAPADGEILFHFIDVGQGDAILVTTKSGNMLVDTSEDNAKDELVSYLDSAGITSFEYVVFTHTDADHIGNAQYVVENFEIKNIIMPDFVATSQTYLNLIDAIEKRPSINVILVGESEDCVQSGYSFYLGSLLNTVIGPTKDFNDPNEMSVVIKSTYGDTSVMLTGDAEKKSEEAILETWKKSDLACDVLKVGHHGASTSTTQEFLDAVSPSIAVISCGEGNKHGHPKADVMDRLEAAGVTIYRTDTQGTIVLRSDGKSISLVE